jgi:hypothetical protein
LREPPDDSDELHVDITRLAGTLVSLDWHVITHYR